jgi:hypothetical protein
MNMKAIILYTHMKGSRGSSVSIVSDYGLGDGGSILGRGERIFPLTSLFRPALGPTQPPVRWVPDVHSPAVKSDRGVTLTTHPHLVPRLRMSSIYTSSPLSASMVCSGTALSFTHMKIKVLQCIDILIHLNLCRPIPSKGT